MIPVISIVYFHILYHAGGFRTWLCSFVVSCIVGFRVTTTVALITKRSLWESGQWVYCRLLVHLQMSSRLGDSWLTYCRLILER